MKMTALLGSACLLFAGQALGQTPPAPSSSAAPSTQDFVTKAAISDMFEVQSSELALQKNPDRDTKPFANRMVKDHTMTTKQLKALVAGGKVKADLPTALDTDHQQMLDQLRSLDGKPFDEAYDKDQLDGHEQAVAMFREYSQGGDNKSLKQWAAKTLPHLEHHLAMAQKLK